MPFEQSVLHIPLIMITKQEEVAWISLDWSKILFRFPYMISLDWSSARKRVTKWDSLNKTDFFSENT